jgi:hydroxymethylglutaryl-CoA lyase|tara:strand:+ start:116 stop:268 length:153 start_codon:yes stop_codon:yes gene_type:complete
MFAQMGVSTGVDIYALIAISATLPKLVGHEIPGQVVKEDTADKRYSIPMH